MVFQQPNLLPWRTVLANATYGLELSKTTSKAQARERAMELTELVGLADAAQSYPSQLSGWMQARVNLARALAVEPEILLLDQPFAAIDAQTREVLQSVLLRVCAAKDMTALFVTHDIAEATFLADRVAVFSPRPGRIVREIDVPWERPRAQELRRTREFDDEVAKSQPALDDAWQYYTSEVIKDAPLPAPEQLKLSVEFLTGSVDGVKDVDLKGLIDASFVENAFGGQGAAK